MDPDALQGFTHLHVHSYYTLLGGGMAAANELATWAAAEGMTHLVLTDISALYRSAEQRKR